MLNVDQRILNIEPSPSPDGSGILFILNLFQNLEILKQVQNKKDTASIRARARFNIQNSLVNIQHFLDLEKTNNIEQRMLK